MNTKGNVRSIREGSISDGAAAKEIFDRAAEAFSQARSLRALDEAFISLVVSIYRVECKAIARTNRESGELMRQIERTAWRRTEHRLAAGTWPYRRPGTRRSVFRYYLRIWDQIVVNRNAGRRFAAQSWNTEEQARADETSGRIFLLAVAVRDELRPGVVSEEEQRHQRATERRPRYDGFRDRMLIEMGTRPNREETSFVAGYNDASQLDRYLSGRALPRAAKNFERVFKMSSADFISLLERRKKL
jgi:hypothetical protein